MALVMRGVQQLQILPNNMKSPHAPHVSTIEAGVRGVVIGSLFLGTVAFGQFLAPANSPYVAGSNSPAPINASNSAQIKQGDLGVDYVVADTLCLGASNCINALWPSSPLSTTCRLESRKIYNNTSNLDVYTNTCDSMLSKQAIDDGWVSTSFDYCTSLSGGNCNGKAQCHYMRLVCSGSATTTVAVSGPRYTMYPVTSSNTGDSYPTFMRDPQCNDGIDNGDPDSLGDFNGIANNGVNKDPQCTGYDDDDETN
jgi:hypothetical protein